MYYVYIIYEASKGIPFYVGKGKGDRYLSHFKQSHNKFLNNKIAKIEAAGGKVVSEIIFRTDDESLAYNLEIQLISQYGRRKDEGTLCNITLGGEGFRGEHSEETKRKRSETAKRMHAEGLIDLGAQWRGKHTPISKPVYFRGFIFPSARTASKAFGGSVSMVASAVKKGRACYIDDEESIDRYRKKCLDDEILLAEKKFKLCMKEVIKKHNRMNTSVRMKAKMSESNHMTGRVGGKHPNARPVIVEGVLYPSLVDAVNNTKYTKSMLEKRLKKNVEGFDYAPLPFLGVIINEFNSTPV